MEKYNAFLTEARIQKAEKRADVYTKKFLESNKKFFENIVKQETDYLKKIVSEANKKFKSNFELSVNTKIGYKGAQYIIEFSLYDDNADGSTIPAAEYIEKNTKDLYDYVEDANNHMDIIFAFALPLNRL